MDKILGLQVPLESTLYKRALQELEKSCGQMCVDGLAEFNRKYAGENLDVACINLGSSNWSWRLANKAMWFLRWLWSNLVMQLPACSLRLVAVLTPSFCVCVCVCVCVELLKRSKTCTSITLAIFWQYMNLFRGAALTSGFPHVHLLIFLCLLEKFYPYCSTFLAGGKASSDDLA